MNSPDNGYLRQNRRVSKVASTTFRDSLSVSLTVGAYGVAFGAASVANGFSVLQSCLLSLQTLSVDAVDGAGQAMGAVISWHDDADDRRTTHFVPH